MKQKTTNRRSRFLLLSLLAFLLGGASPTWAGTITESFESVTVDANDNTKLSNGWFIKGGTNIVTKNVTNSSYWSNNMPEVFDYIILGTGGSYNIGANSTNTAFGQYNNGCTSYLVIPTELTGKIKFYAGGIRSSNTNIKLYRVSYDGENYSIGTQIGSTIYTSGRTSSSTRPNWLASKQEVNLGSEHTMVAFLLNGTAIDEVEAEEYVFTPYVEPATLSAVVEGNTAEVSWTAGATEETLTGWNLEYKKTTEDAWTEVHGIGASTLSNTLNNLEVGNSYDVRVSALYGENESVWKSISFSLVYTTPAPTSVDGDGITNVTFGTGAEIVNFDTSKSPYYQNNSAQVGAVTAGSETTVAITFSTGYTYGTVVWVDWNQNYTFEDSEIVFAGECTSVKPNTLNAVFTVPAEQAVGNYRMRICAADSYYDSHKTMGTAAGANATPTSSYCVAQDYTLKVKEAAAYAMSVSETAIAFGTVKNTTTTKTFTIVNDGDNALTDVSVVSSNNEIFTVSDSGFDIAAAGSKEITVTFVKDVAGDYEETITISQANIATNKVVNVTATYEAPTSANMAITLGEEAVGATVAFGNVGKQTTKTFTVTNDGDQTLNVTSIESNNTTDFTVSPASLEVAGHSSETFTVTFVYPNEDPVLDAEKTANITVTASNAGIDPVVFAVTGTRIELWSEDFSGNALPAGWTADENYWTFADGVAKSKYNSYTRNNYLFTPLLIVESTSETLTFDYTTTAGSVSIPVYYSKNGGDYTAYAGTPSGLASGVSGTFTITGLEAGSYKFRFGNDDYNLDNFQGFKRNLNDPKLGIYSDAECTVAVATSVTKDFGFATETQTAAYYIKNDGTGTMTLSLGDAPAGLTQSLDKTSVAAGEHATLTITMPVANKGYNGGNVVVTATDLGTFTVAVSGVIVDEDKLNLNFASDNIPATWTANDWMKDASGYLKTGQYGYSNTSMETTKLTAEAGEKLVVVAKNGSSSNTYTFGIKYKKVDAEEWSDLIAAANIGTSWTTLVGTIAEAGDYLFQFNGYYANIQRIYGLSVPDEPVMVVYDGEELVAATHDFGNVSDEADATWSLTVKNEGKAGLTGLAAALTGDDAAHYSVEVSATSVAVDGSTTITVKQLKDNLGSHNATLTISATGLADHVITLNGKTYDHTKLFVDFEDGNLPAGWTKGSYWTVSQVYGQDNRSLAHSYSSSSASSVTTTPLTVAKNEVLTFGASRYYSSSAPTLKVRYTADGGLTWSDYTDFSSEITNSYSGNTFKELTLEGVPAGTVVLEFYGSYVRLDNIYGFTPTTAPMITLKEGITAVANGSTKEFGTLTAQATATYTLTNNGNGAMISTVATTGVATAVISGAAEGVTIDENTVTLAAGKSATITLTLPYAAPYGEKNGAMTITTEGWVGDFTVNYTATTVDPTALYEDFSGNAKPEGWYNDGWTFSTGYASAAYVANKQMITQKLTCAGTEDALSFDVWPYTSAYGSYAHALTVEYSADRKNWTAFANQPTFESTERQNGFQVSGAPAGDYYVRFTGSYVYVDNIAGWHKVTGIEHDLYVSTTTFPTNTLIPGTTNGVAATATVYSLRADETDVYAKLFFDETEMATSTAKDIDNNDSQSFTMICDVPAEEGTYAAKIVVYYSDNSVAFETLTTNVEVAHTRTLEITAFARDGEGTMNANEQNQISPVFNVTVKNNGTTNYTSPTVKVFNGEVEVGSATSDATVAPNGTTQLTVTATNMSAGEGGNLSFTAKAYWDAAEFSYDTPVVITVNAAAPKFDLAVKGGEAVEDGDAVAFGLVKTATTKTFTITNSGTAALELVSIVAPSGYSATAVTDANKTIAVDGTLDIDVTLAAEQGKVAGNLVITYKVDAMTNNTFTLALSGRSVAEDTWTVDFEDGSIPSNWDNSNGWAVYETDGNKVARLTGWDAKAIITPRLAAQKDEILTFDVLNVGNSISYAYSTDRINWSDEVVINATGEQTFTAPANGNYYLRITARNAYVDNFVGFILNPNNLVLNQTETPVFAGEVYDNITLNRAFIEGWNTVCLPFAIADIEDFFGAGAYAYSFSGFDAGVISFAKEDAMDAATPYLVYVPSAIASKNLTNVVVSDAVAGSVTNNEVTFQGTYAPIAAGDLTGKYVLTPEAKIAKAGNSATMNGFRAYFVVPAETPVKALVFDDGTATGIEIIDVTAEPARDIFDLAGRKLNEVRKGVNIVNGKKILKK